MKTFQHSQPKVNIIVDPVKNGWQAKVYRADTGAVAYATVEYANKQVAYNDARRWATQNHYLIGRIFGMEDVLPPPPPRKERRPERSYSANWSKI